MSASTLITLKTLVIGIGGALVGTALGLPVAPLIGSALLVALATLAGIKTHSSNLLRNISFAILGASLGSGITPESLALMGKWPWSLLALALNVVLMLVISTWVLARYFSMSVTTGLLSSSPGALSSTISLASEGYGEVRTVIVLQCLRIMLVMMVLPIIIQSLGLQSQSAITLTTESLNYAYLPSLLGLVFCLALILERYKFPAAFIVTGLLISGVGHGSGLLHGVMPYPLVVAAFIVIGGTVGVRFDGIQRHELKQYAWAALTSVTLSSGVAALLAYWVASALNLPFGQVWVAYSPGGVEAMAALAMAMHYDPAYVAVHHLSRLVGLILTLPWIVMWLAKRQAKSH